MRLSKRLTLLASLTSALASCDIYACRYETRFIATSGSASSTTFGTVTATFVNFRDYSEGEPTPTSITFNIAASNLQAQPTSLTLRDVRDTTRVVAVFPIRTGSGILSASAVDLTTADERNRVFSLLSSGNGVLVIAGPPNETPLLVRLGVTAREDWHRPSCD
jgi:hypothetical protein